MSKWSEKWNMLPDEIRQIGSMVEAEMRINQLNMEKRRLKSRYCQSIKEVNGHIKNLEQWIRNEGR